MRKNLYYTSHHPYNHLLKSGCAEVAAALLLLLLPGRCNCTPPPLQYQQHSPLKLQHTFFPTTRVCREDRGKLSYKSLGSRAIVKVDRGSTRMKAIKNLPQSSYPPKSCKADTEQGG